MEKYCYANMFMGCTNLTETPILPSTTLAEECYSGMFWGCEGLTKAHDLPATTLTMGCYRYMFKNCTSLKASPLLPAPKLVDFCYEQMFDGCSSLSKVVCLITDFNDAWWGLYYWLNKVSPTGTFVMAKDMESQWPIGGEFGYPSGWNSVEYDPTGIHAIENAQTNSGKYFDLGGSYTSTPHRGLIIHNGKKTIVR